MPEEVPVAAPVAPAAPALPSKTLWTYSKDILTILVIPLFIWGVKLEVGNALRDQAISSLEGEVSELKEDLKEAKTVDSKVQANSVQLVRLEGKIDLANGRLDEIRNLVAR